MTQKITNNREETEKSHPGFLGTKVYVVAALGAFTGANLLYGTNRASFLSANSSEAYSILSFGLLLLGAVLLSLGSVSYLQAERWTEPSIDGKSRLKWRLGKIISDSLFLQKKVVAVSAVVYALFFAFVDGILVYQPGVDFASQYLVSKPSVIIETCCGPPGYVPVGLIYLPAQHFGIQLIPISIFTMVLVSLLVGLNVSLLNTAVKQTKSKEVLIDTSMGKRFAGGALGAALGLFAGCPTCAAAFFLSMIAGSGATAFSALVSEFQPVIIGLSIPLLLVSIIFQAKNVRNFLFGCSIRNLKS